MNKLIAFLNKITTLTGLAVAPLTLVMMLLTCIVVVARYVFNIGAIPLQEAVVYLHACVFMIGIAYTFQQSKHVRVDILYQRFSPKMQAVVDLLGSIFFLFPFCIFILWSSKGYVMFSWQLGETSAEPGGLPFVYLLKSLIPLMALLLLSQGIAAFILNLSKLLSPSGNK